MIEVRFEIKRSYERRMGILAIDIHNIKDPLSELIFAGRNPLEHWKVGETPFTSLYRTYDWVRDDGYNNVGSWIELAARTARR